MAFSKEPGVPLKLQRLFQRHSVALFGQIRRYAALFFLVSRSLWNIFDMVGRYRLQENAKRSISFFSLRAHTVETKCTEKFISNRPKIENPDVSHNFRDTKLEPPYPKVAICDGLEHNRRLFLLRFKFSCSQRGKIIQLPRFAFPQPDAAVQTTRRIILLTWQNMKRILSIND